MSATETPKAKPGGPPEEDGTAAHEGTEDVGLEEAIPVHQAHPGGAEVEETALQSAQDAPDDCEVAIGGESRAQVVPNSSMKAQVPALSLDRKEAGLHPRSTGPTSMAVLVKEAVPKADRELVNLEVKTHVVLLGDSTLDNERYLDVDAGDQPVRMQLSRRCEQMHWEFTSLAADGSTLEDVAIRQVPIIPDDATHLVLSASGNDLLRLLNEVASSEFSVSSLYQALTEGLQEVSRKYRRIVESMASTGCHIACCTVYQPNFKNSWLKALAAGSLSLHNSRIRRIARDLDFPVLDLASLCQDPEDFANPLELSSRGGKKLVQNLTEFVKDHPSSMLPRPPSFPRDRKVPWLLDVLGLQNECCHCHPRGKAYGSAILHEELIPELAPSPSDFAQAQENWRHS